MPNSKEVAIADVISIMDKIQGAVRVATEKSKNVKDDEMNDTQYSVFMSTSVISELEKNLGTETKNKRFLIRLVSDQLEASRKWATKTANTPDNSVAETMSKILKLIIKTYKEFRMQTQEALLISRADSTKSLHLAIHSLKKLKAKTRENDRFYGRNIIPLTLNKVADGEEGEKHLSTFWNAPSDECGKIDTGMKYEGDEKAAPMTMKEFVSSSYGLTQSTLRKRIIMAKTIVRLTQIERSILRLAAADMYKDNTHPQPLQENIQEAVAVEQGQ